MLKSVPHFMRRRFRHSLLVVLQERCRAKLVGDRVGEERAWKAFGFAPAMLLHRPEGVSSIGRVELMERANKFARGQWADLLEELCHPIHSRLGATRSEDSTRGVQPLDEQDVEQKKTRGPRVIGCLIRSRSHSVCPAFFPGSISVRLLDQGRNRLRRTRNKGPDRCRPRLHDIVYQRRGSV